MNIQNPIALLGLLLIPIVILLKLWRLRPVTHIVSSIFIWQRLKDKGVAERVQQRWKFTFILLLQCLAIASLVLALANPAFTRMKKVSRHAIIILDNSASMTSLKSEGVSVGVKEFSVFWISLGLALI